MRLAFVLPFALLACTSATSNQASFDEALTGNEFPKQLNCDVTYSPYSVHHPCADGVVSGFGGIHGDDCQPAYTMSYFNYPLASVFPAFNSTIGDASSLPYVGTLDAVPTSATTGRFTMTIIDSASSQVLASRTITAQMVDGTFDHVGSVAVDASFTYGGKHYRSVFVSCSGQ